MQATGYIGYYDLKAWVTRRQMKSTIIIPAFNEEASIGDVVRIMGNQYPEMGVIVVDDGSTDDTLSQAELAGAKIIRHYTNLGYGAALKTGVRSTDADVIIFFDADGQHDPRDVGRLVQAIEDCDMVVGVRQKESYVPPVRRPGKRILNWVANIVCGQRIPDVNSGLRAIRRDIFLKYVHLLPYGFSLSTTTTIAFLKAGRVVKYIPIVVKKRQGASTVRQLKHGPESLLLILRLIVLFEPLKIFLAVAGGLFALSIFSLVIDLVLTKSGGISDTTVLLSIATLIVFMFGLVCDQVSALRRQRNE
jgi:glycosyltransferase involved in cell wall biosynthesis